MPVSSSSLLIEDDIVDNDGCSGDDDADINYDAVTDDEGNNDGCDDDVVAAGF